MKQQRLKICNLLMWVLPIMLKAQVITYSFTNAGTVGQNGPTQAQINAAYLTTNLNGSVTVLTGSLAGIQQFTIPVTGPYRIVAAGSPAGPGVGLVTYSNGCRGRIVQGDVFLTAGTVLKILVGVFQTSEELKGKNIGVHLKIQHIACNFDVHRL